MVVLIGVVREEPVIIRLVLLFFMVRFPAHC
jgi:hypothetical protein